MKKYGGQCVYCKTTELAVLTIDHKDDNGAPERKTHSCSRRFYHKLRTDSLREDLQVLCFNCQWRKRMYGSDFTTWEGQKFTTDRPSKPIRTYHRHKPLSL